MIPSDTSIPSDNAVLAGTVKLYERHLFICTGQTEWPAHIEQDGGFAQALVQTIAAAGAVAAGANMAQQVKVTACDLPPSRPGSFDLLVFPDGLRYRGVTEANLPVLVADHLAGDQPSSHLIHTPDTGRYIFVCTHGQRDARCGQCGPPLAARLTAELAARGLAQFVTVSRTSHVGGHVYAGNVLIYPGGDWYGYVTPDNVPRLVETTIVNNHILPDLWRGRLGLTPEQQINLHVVLTNHP